MRRVAVSLIALILSACAYQPEIERPVGDGAPSPAPATTGEAPTSSEPTFTTDGCPVDEPAFCEQAAFLANALVLSDADAVFDLSRPSAFECSELDAATFPQCEDRARLRGYVIGNHRGELFVEGPALYRDELVFLVEAIDEEYTDELGGPEMQILGVSGCGQGASRSYHLVYLVALGDPESTLPGARFLGTYELTRRAGEWAVGAAYVALYSDWQLVLDDPLSQVACGRVLPWAGEVANANPPQSEAQPTPSPGS